ARAARTGGRLAGRSTVTGCAAARGRSRKRPGAPGVCPVIRRRRSTREARGRWVFGRTAALARMIASQPVQAMMTPRANRVAELIELGPGKRYLDIGCGTGAYAYLLAARAGLDEPPVTVDLVPGPFPVDLVTAPEHLPFGDD